MSLCIKHIPYARIMNGGCEGLRYENHLIIRTHTMLRTLKSLIQPVDISIKTHITRLCDYCYMQH